MNWILLTAFGASCLLLIVVPLRERAGFLHFPFLAGGGVMSFLFLQAVGVVRNGSLVPDGALGKTFIMCILCNIALLLGWKSPTPDKWRAAPKWAYPQQKLFAIGLIFLVVGAIGQVELIALNGGLVKSFSADAEIREWSGLPVAWLYIGLFAQTGTVFVGLAALKARAYWRLLLVAPFVLLQFFTVIAGARRFPLVLLGVTIVAIFYFGKRSLPPKAYLLGFGVLCGAALFIFPVIRGSTSIGADRTRLKNFDGSELSRNVLEGTRDEFYAAAYLIQITGEEGIYMLGGGFYNDFVRYFVPKLLVGDDRKADLYLKLPDPMGGVPNSYSFVPPEGVVPTGPASVFIQFGYAGAALYWLLARGMKCLWTRALAGDSLGQCLYTLLIVPATGALVADFTGALYANGLQIFVAPLMALLFIKVQTIQRPFERFHNATTAARQNGLATIPMQRRLHISELQ